MMISFSDEQVARVVYAAEIVYDEASGQTPGVMYGAKYDAPKEGDAPKATDPQGSEPKFEAPKMDVENAEQPDAYKARVAAAREEHEKNVAASAENAKKQDEATEEAESEQFSKMSDPVRQSRVAFDSLPDEEKKALIDHVAFARQYPGYNVEAHHSYWLNIRQALGWSAGPASGEDKTMPYTDAKNLPTVQDEKWQFLLGIIRSMSTDQGNGNKQGYA